VKVGDLVQVQYQGKKPQKSVCIVLSIQTDGETAEILTRVGPMPFLTRDLKRVSQ